MKLTKEKCLHFIMCLNGGFVGGYSLLCRSSNFGSAQTANIYQMIFSLLDGNLREHFMRLIGLLIYCLGIIICIILQNKREKIVQNYAILINLVGAIVLSLLPKNIHPLIGLLTSFFMTASQWTVFHGYDGFNCSTIFSTNNIRQFVSATIERYFFKKKEQEKKVFVYLGTLVCFYSGAFLAAISYNKLDIYSSLISVPILLFAWILSMEHNPLIELYQKNRFGGLL